METLAIHLARTLSWSAEPDGTARLLDPRRDSWVRLQPWTVGVLEGIASGDDLAGILARVAAREDAPREERVRRFVLDLEKAGYVKVDVPAPAALGPYRVVRELGRGGVGIAYLCEGDDGPLVCKRAWSYLFPLWATSRLVEWEADVLGGLDHPGVVRGRGSFREGDVAVLAREAVDGEPLGRRHDARPARPEEALRIAREIADIVVHLHARGWLLVDANPSNFFVAGDRVVLADAGNCLRLDGSGPAGVRPGGSRGFVPPEVHAGARHDARSDVWALGRLLAFVASGRLTRKDPTLAELREGLPAGVTPLVERLCADDPTGRPASAAEAARILSAGS